MKNESGVIGPARMSCGGGGREIKSERERERERAFATKRRYVRPSHATQKVGQSRMAEMQRHLQKVSAGEREAKVCPERMA